jgi:hypothetical protein
MKKLKARPQISAVACDLNKRRIPRYPPTVNSIYGFEFVPGDNLLLRLKRALDSRRSMPSLIKR